VCLPWLLGEYVGAIYTRVQERPYAIEQERINFQYDFPEPDQAEQLRLPATSSEGF
jgi:hypothetical protein